MELIKKSDQPTAQSVKEKNPLARIVGMYAQLKPMSGGMICNCPLPTHEDSTPSFVVYENTQRFCCFGCGATGDVITFIQSMRNVGFRDALEILNGNNFGVIVPIVRAVKEPPKPVADGLKKQYEKLFEVSTQWEGYSYSAESIGGFSASSWMQLGAAWSDSKKSWVIPMRNSACEIIGFQLRNGNGFKWCVEGSRLGLFIPRIHVAKTAWICEGASDTAALVSIGFYAFGRPSAQAGIDMAVEFCHTQKIERVIIMADNNDAGISGAEKLSKRIGIENKVILPPREIDVRKFIFSGGTREELESLARN